MGVGVCKWGGGGISWHRPMLDTPLNINSFHSVGLNCTTLQAGWQQVASWDEEIAHDVMWYGDTTRVQLTKNLKQTFPVHGSTARKSHECFHISASHSVYGTVSFTFSNALHCYWYSVPTRSQSLFLGSNSLIPSQHNHPLIIPTWRY